MTMAEALRQFYPGGDIEAAIAAGYTDDADFFAHVAGGVELVATRRRIHAIVSQALGRAQLTVAPCDCCTTAPTDSEGEE